GLEQGLEAPRGELAQQQKHPLPAPQVQVQAGNIPQGPPAEHPTRLRPHILQPQPAKLIPHQALQAEQTRNRKIRHRATSLIASYLTPQYSRRRGERQWGPGETGIRSTIILTFF